ncbi:MAG: hypothetical protein NE330_07765, partial [Lentisphaeraceae bacterium]|nr:hypothetical protein [Lentisphaeraceae bacterium]
STRMFDVWTMLAFGGLGYVFERMKIPLAPFVIGFILAPIAEQNLMAGLMSSDGSFMPILTRPVSCIFMVSSIILLAFPIIKKARKSSQV